MADLKLLRYMGIPSERIRQVKKKMRDDNAAVSDILNAALYCYLEYTQRPEFLARRSQSAE
jgi:hypothetical protein